MMTIGVPNAPKENLSEKIIHTRQTILLHKYSGFDWLLPFVGWDKNWNEIAIVVRDVWESKCYRRTHGSFKKFCRERFHISVSWAYKLIKLSKINEG